MLTNANKGTYLVQNWQKYANVIYERPLTKIDDVEETKVPFFNDDSIPPWSDAMSQTIVIHGLVYIMQTLHYSMSMLRKNRLHSRWLAIDQLI